MSRLFTDQFVLINAACKTVWIRNRQNLFIFQLIPKGCCVQKDNQSEKPFI